MKRLLLFALLTLAFAGLTLFAQTTATTEPAATSTATTDTADDSAELEQSLQGIWETSADDDYRYDPQGRRDPFRSLIGPSPKLEKGDRPPGAAGFMIEEMDLQGVIRTKQGFVAMVNGPDNRGYSLRAGEKVFDGEVIRIDRNAVVFRQIVNDPLSVARYREVVKELTPQSQRNTP